MRWVRILDGHFSTLRRCEIVKFASKDRNKHEKRPGMAHLKIIPLLFILVLAFLHQNG